MICVLPAAGRVQRTQLSSLPHDHRHVRTTATQPWTRNSVSAFCPSVQRTMLVINSTIIRIRKLTEWRAARAVNKLPGEASTWGR